MSTTADLRKGAVIKFNNDPCLVLESEHRTPGNLRAFYQVKMRNLRSGKLLENRYRSGESIEFLRVERREYQFLYKDGEDYVFMDNGSYEQITVAPVAIGDGGRFMKETTNVEISMNEGEILAVDLPQHVTLRVIQSDPAARGDTVNNVMKPAVLETGAQVSVPSFVNEGDLIRIETATGAYMDRVKE
jgi:elongation factor P